jgi:arylsulfatase A-like enzyme
MYPLEDIQIPAYKSDDLQDAFDHGRSWIHQWVLDNDQWKKVVQSYAASMTFSDAMLGRLIDQFENSEYAKNTIVVVWSDHGMHMGEKDNIEKFTLWERSTHVPLLISAPGFAHNGDRCNQPVSLMDIYPTLVDLAGFERPDHLDGHSLVPQMKNPELKTSPVITSYQFTWTKEPVVGHAVRSKDYRYIYYPEIDLEELYDLKVDPNEWENIAYKAENRNTIDMHRKTLKEMLPDLSWNENAPEGYEVDSEGNIRKLDFSPLQLTSVD